MSLTRRQILGTGLIATAIIAAILLQIYTGDFVHWRETKEESVDHPMYSYTVQVEELSLVWKYALPVAACFAAGLFCILKRGPKSKT